MKQYIRNFGKFVLNEEETKNVTNNVAEEGIKNVSKEMIGKNFNGTLRATTISTNIKGTEYNWNFGDILKWSSKSAGRKINILIGNSIPDFLVENYDFPKSDYKEGSINIGWQDILNEDVTMVYKSKTGKYKEWYTLLK